MEEGGGGGWWRWAVEVGGLKEEDVTVRVLRQVVTALLMSPQSSRPHIHTRGFLAGRPRSHSIDDRVGGLIESAKKKGPLEGGRVL